MALSDFHLRASIAVSDIQRAAAFYEGRLGLQALQSGPSAKIAAAPGSTVWVPKIVSRYATWEHS